MVIKANSLKMLQKICGMLPNTKIKVFAVGMLQQNFFDSEKFVNHLVR